MAEVWWAYLLRCSDGSLYAGATNDVTRRLAAHNAGRGARYTRSRRPVALVWKQGVLGKSRALSLEALLKSLTRAQKLQWVRQGRHVRRFGANAKPA